MKKIILALLTFCALTSIALGGMVIQKTSSAGGTDCPSGTYLFAWDGDYSIGGADTDKGCFTNGTVTKDGTLAGTGALSTDYGESGSVGFRHLVTDDTLKWLISSADGLDPTEGTIYIRLYMLTTAETSYTFLGYYDVSNFMQIRILNSNEVSGKHTRNSVENYQWTSSGISDTTWTTIGFTWKVNEAGNDIGSTHDGTTWVESDLDDITEWTTDPTYLHLGGAGADDFYVTKIVILSTHKASLPAWW